jgi:predicted protein tyrosine phosphatase
MSEALKILFVCSQNKWRSLTAEKIYAGFPGYAVKSAGTEENARIKVTEGHVGWADLIFAMEKQHVDRLRDKFPEALAGKRIVCLHIAANLEYMNPQLVELLKSKLSEYIEVPE